MYSDNKQIRDVADVAARIMSGQQPVSEKLHPNQQKLDVHEPEKDKLTADDFKHLRAGKKPAEVKKEEVEQIQEYESKGGVYKHKGTYGTEKSVEAGYTDYDKENELAKKNLKNKPNRKKYGARQNYVRSTRVNESFSALLSVYKETGLKGLAEALVKEEPTNDQYNAELDDAKAKAEGKKKQPDLTKGYIQAVKNEETEIEVIDADKVNGVQIDNIEEGLMSGVKNVVKSAVSTVKDVQSKERAFQAQKQKKAGEVLSQLRKEESEEQIDEKEMTDAEMKKREEIVKSMKKGMTGFKERYGERAKNVMYATATKQAMKD
jgi:hypothetical protein